MGTNVGIRNLFAAEGIIMTAGGDDGMNSAVPGIHWRRHREFRQRLIVRPFQSYRERFWRNTPAIWYIQPNLALYRFGGGTHLDRDALRFLIGKDKRGVGQSRKNRRCNNQRLM